MEDKLGNNESAIGTDNKKSVLTVIGGSNTSVNEVSSASSSFGAPNFGSLSKIFVIANKKAERLNAAEISEEEQQSLLEERQLLLDKLFDGVITRTETNRLNYIKWSLDRIEDAKHGDSLDRIEEFVTRYERFERHLHSFQNQLNANTSSGQAFIKKRKKK